MPAPANNQATLTHGVLGGSTSVTSTFDASGLASTEHVTLSQNYARVIPPGYPDPNAGAPIGASKTATPQTIASGSRVLFFAHEANAIVAAAGGSLS